MDAEHKLQPIVNIVGGLNPKRLTIRDVPVVQGIVLTGAIIVLVVNLVIDMALFYLVPKSR